ncbi:MAG: 50S ribosomal protein L6 [Firmicutes bacterium]|nr:50S ribosomal protein L6 [Bacillota bacterium]
MSRIGRLPIAIPAGVDVDIDGSTVTVKGPKGTLSRQFHPNIAIEKKENTLHVTRPDDAQQNRALHGLSRSLLANMVTGVNDGFRKDLEVNGVGYRAQKQGEQLVLNIGYSHQVIMEAPEGVTVEVPSPGKIIISGYDKQRVGQFAAEVREKRPPEPYKGKGIKYAAEVIRRKEGKSGKGK